MVENLQYLWFKAMITVLEFVRDYIEKERRNKQPWEQRLEMGMSSIWVKFSKYVEQLEPSHHIFGHWESLKKRQPKQHFARVSRDDNPWTHNEN